MKIKTKANKAIILFLAILVSVSLLALPGIKAGAFDEDYIGSGEFGRNLFWTLNEYGILTIYGNGYMAFYGSKPPWFEYQNEIRMVIIEEGVENIEENAFYECINIETVIINGASKLEKIGDHAFYKCSSLSYVYNIPKSVSTIGYRAFYECGLMEIDISPESQLSFIATETFYGCKYLREINIPDSVKCIQNGAFWECESLEKVNIPDSVTSIEEEAFRDCENLAEINITENSLLNHIGRFAFYGCANLKSINIPEQVEWILDAAFTACVNLMEIKVDPDNLTFSNDEKGILYDKTKTTLICFPGGIGGNFSIPENVTTIGNYAFSSCINLTSVNIPESVTTIGNDAFSSCINLTSVNIPKYLMIINNRTFIYCSRLTTIHIPDSVEYIGYNVFYACERLLEINVAPNNLYFSNNDDGVLYDKEKTILICFPGGKGEDFNIPDSVTTIGNVAFGDCINLTTFNIPDSVTIIEDNAFWWCKNLRSVTFEGNAPAMGVNIFYNTASDFKIYYYKGASGWSNPWYGYATEMMIKYLYGDLDGKDGITMNDLVKLSRHIAEIELIKTPTLREAADVNGDDKITIADLIRLARYIADIDKTPLGK